MVAAVVLAGCQSGEPDESADSAGPQSSAGSTPSAQQSEQELVRQARSLGESYDYDAAIDLLETSDTRRAQEWSRKLKSRKGQSVAWPMGEPVPHLFFHSLVVDPERAFDGDDAAPGYDDYMATVREFDRTLDALLERDYVLVEPRDIATVGGDGHMQYRTIRLPRGKKPLVLSLDDLSYYEYMEGDGFADRLVLDDSGRVRNEYTDASGRTRTGAYDMVPILDDFVSEHPEFSYHGAKGVIAMTGYDGVLGYRTSLRSHADRKDLGSDRRAAKRVATAMKSNGWTFASHTWGHINMTTAPLAKVRADHERWTKDVEPLVGPTDMLIYPFGADISDTSAYSGPTYDYLKEQGFDYFFNVDGGSSWQQREGGYLRQARMNVDGITLRRNISGASDGLDPFVTAEDVIDPRRDR